MSSSSSELSALSSSSSIDVLDSGLYEVYNGGVATFLAAFTPAFVVAAVVFILFIYIRRNKGLTWNYAPLSLNDNGSAKGLGFTWLSWIPELYNRTDAEVLAAGGLDGLMFVKFFVICIKIMAANTVPAIILMCVNATAKGVPGKLGLDLFTLTNVAAGDVRIWTHLLCMIFFSVTVWMYTHQLYVEFVVLRSTFMLTDSSSHHKSVLFMNVPIDESLNHEENTAQVTGLFSKVYGNDFTGAVLNRNTTEFDQLIEEENVIVRKIDHIKAKLAAAEEAGADSALDADVVAALKAQLDPAAVFPAMCGMKEVKSLVGQHADIAAKIEALEEPKTVTSAFVSFKTFMARNAALTVPLVLAPGAYDASPASEPRDVYWANTNLPAHVRTIKSLLAKIILGALLIFWTVPVTFVGSISTLSNLTDLLPFLEPLLNLSDSVRGIIEGLLPTLALIIFLAILPLILAAIHRLEGLTSVSEIEKAVCASFFMFQVIHSFLVVTLASGIFSVLEDLIENPTSAANLLGQAIPSVANFFAGYVMLQTLGGFPLRMFAIVRVIVVKIKAKYLDLDETALKELYEPLPINYGTEYPMHLFVLLLAFVYATISPIVLLLALVYFVVGYITVKYEVLLKIRNNYERGGDFWPVVFDRILAALIIAQVAFIGLMGLKESSIQAALALPLPFVTYVYMSKMNEMYLPKSVFIPLQLTVSAPDSANNVVSVDAKQNSSEDVEMNAIITIHADQSDSVTEAGKIDSTFDRLATQRQQRPAATVAEE